MNSRTSLFAAALELFGGALALIGSTLIVVTLYLMLNQ